MKLKLAFAAAAVVLAAGVTLFAQERPASGHGAMLIPGSRTYLCYVDGHISTGEIQP